MLVRPVVDVHDAAVDRRQVVELDARPHRERCGLAAVCQLQ